METSHSIQSPANARRFSILEDIKNNPITTVGFVVSLGGILKSKTFWAVFALLPRVATKVVKPAMVVLLISQFLKSQKKTSPTTKPQQHHD